MSWRWHVVPHRVWHGAASDRRFRLAASGSRSASPSPAYRGYGKQVGWTSFDGRSWEPLVFQGRRPTSEPGKSDPASVIVMPIGVKLQNLDGSIWFGTPITNG